MTDVPDPTVDEHPTCAHCGQPAVYLYPHETRCVNCGEHFAGDPPTWVSRPVKDGKPDISSLTAADVAEWIEGEARAAEIARTTFDRREEQ